MAVSRSRPTKPREASSLGENGVSRPRKVAKLDHDDQQKHDNLDEPGPSFYLMKSEPDSFSIDDLERREEQTEPWDGVRNHAAKNIMKKMKLGEKAFLYQSNCKVPGIVGIMEIVREAYPDYTAWQKGSKYFDPKSTEEKPTWFMVDCKLVRRLDRTIGLHELKGYRDGPLADMALFKQSRLSVQPVRASEWQFILDLEQDVKEV